MTVQNIDQIISNLSKCDYQFSYDIIHASFKGNQKNLLLKFINKEISEDYLKVKWGEVNLTGNLLEDVKLDELTLLDRLKLLVFVLDKLEVPNSYQDVFNKSVISQDDCSKALALLVYDLYSKSDLKAKKKESLVKLLEQLRQDKNKIPYTPDCLIPHEPENTTCTLGNSTSEIEDVNEEEEEVVNTEDLATLSI